MKFLADHKGIPLVALLGTKEIAQGVVKLKRLGDGEEFTANREDVAAKIDELLG